MKITIHVTKEILERSKDCDFKNGFVSRTCAVANAIREIFPNAQVAGNYMDTWIGDDWETRKIPVPTNMLKFIYRFDGASPQERLQMQAESFDIDVPESIIDKIGIDQVNEILS